MAFADMVKKGLASSKRLDRYWHETVESCLVDSELLRMYWCLS